MEFEELSKEHKGLIKSVANKYKGNGIPFEDLVHYGEIGLWRASTKFDEKQGNKFSTLATYWIKWEIEDGIATESGDLSQYRIKQIRKMKRAESELTQELKREPTDKEIADKLEIPLEKLVELKTLAQQNISLDNTIDSESDSTISDFIADNSMTPEEQLIYEEEKKDSKLIKEAFLKTLYPYERMVYFLRIEKNQKITYVAKKLGVGRTRISKIEKDIKEKQAVFFRSEEYYNIVNGKSESVLKEIIKEQKRNIDASAKGEKFAEYENYEDLPEIDFKELSKRFESEYASALMFPTFGTYFKDVCDKHNITCEKFCRATGLSKSQFDKYKSDHPTPSVSAIVSFGIYFKIGSHTINNLLELGGYNFKLNDRTHLAYTFVLEQLKGYPIKYCNKVLELLGVEKDYFLNSDKKKRKKNKKTK